MSKLHSKLKLLYPDTDTNLFGLNYSDSAGWFINPPNWKAPQAIPKPEELDALEADAEAYEAVESVRLKRAKAYPSLEDQMDAIFKGGKDFDDMKLKIADIKTANPFSAEQLAVKAKYPKV